MIASPLAKSAVAGVVSVVEVKAVPTAAAKSLACAGAPIDPLVAAVAVEGSEAPIKLAVSVAAIALGLAVPAPYAVEEVSEVMDDLFMDALNKAFAAPSIAVELLADVNVSPFVGEAFEKLPMASPSQGCSCESARPIASFDFDHVLQAWMPSCHV